MSAAFEYVAVLLSTPEMVEDQTRRFEDGNQDDEQFSAKLGDLVRRRFMRKYALVTDQESKPS